MRSTPPLEGFSTFLHRRRAGFSLAEVIVALGLVTAGLLAVVGMLPVGARTANSVVQEQRAVSLMTEAESAIRGMRLKPGNDRTYVLGDFLSQYNRDYEFTLGSSALQLTFPVKEDSRVDTPLPGSQNEVAVNPTDGSFYSQALRIELSSFGSANLPEDKLTPVQALISVAWPGTGAKWDQTTNDWQNVEGSVTSLIYVSVP
ncbi:MAG: hypothetical protein AAF555_09455 [Verrucomicrobiota bacterium]